MGVYRGDNRVSASFWSQGLSLAGPGRIGQGESPVQATQGTPLWPWAGPMHSCGEAGLHPQPASTLPPQGPKPLKPRKKPQGKLDQGADPGLIEGSAQHRPQPDPLGRGLSNTEPAFLQTHKKELPETQEPPVPDPPRPVQSKLPIVPWPGWAGQALGYHSGLARGLSDGRERRGGQSHSYPLALGHGLRVLGQGVTATCRSDLCLGACSQSCYEGQTQGWREKFSRTSPDQVGSSCFFYRTQTDGPPDGSSQQPQGLRNPLPTLLRAALASESISCKSILNERRCRR